MEKINIKKLSFLLILSLLFLSNSSVKASTEGGANETSSLYQYGALENTTSFAVLASNVGISEENTTHISSNNSALSPEASPFDTFDSKEAFSNELEDTINKQAFTVETLEKTMSNINKNNHGVKTFLLGTNVGIMKFQLAQIKDQAALLKKMSTETEDAAEQASIVEHQKILRDEQTKVEDFLFQQENRFSLFGWILNII